MGFAPYLSSLTECNFPDMSNHDPQSSHWVQNYILNTIFRSRYPDPFHQIAMAYMRRAEACFQEYNLARSALISYFSGPREAVSKYFSSVYHFEQVVAQAYQAYMLMRHMLHNPRLYQHNDESELDRLNKIYNHIKHCDGKLSSGAFPEKMTLSIWLTNDGINCSDAKLKCDEFVEMLEDISNGANRFGDPVAFMNEPGPENA